MQLLGHIRCALNRNQYHAHLYLAAFLPLRVPWEGRGVFAAPAVAVGVQPWWQNTRTLKLNDKHFQQINDRAIERVFNVLKLT